MESGSFSSRSSSPWSACSPASICGDRYPHKKGNIYAVPTTAPAGGPDLVRPARAAGQPRLPGLRAGGRPGRAGGLRRLISVPRTVNPTGEVGKGCNWRQRRGCARPACRWDGTQHGLNRGGHVHHRASSQGPGLLNAVVHRPRPEGRLRQLAPFEPLTDARKELEGTHTASGGGKALPFTEAGEGPPRLARILAGRPGMDPEAPSTRIAGRGLSAPVEEGEGPETWPVRGHVRDDIHQGKVAGTEPLGHGAWLVGRPRRDIEDRSGDERALGLVRLPITVAAETHDGFRAGHLPGGVPGPDNVFKQLVARVVGDLIRGIRL